jgi:hypothetical protein
MFFLVAALAAATAGSSTPTVFGLEFGKPISIPTCRHPVLAGGMVAGAYETEPTTMCYEPDIELSGGVPWRRGSVDFPTSSQPLVSKVNMISTLIVNGKLEGLEISTPDHNHTLVIVDELTKKFGKPTEVHHQQAEVQGIAVPALEFSWRLHGLTVTYTNVDDDIDYGSIEIETPVMQKLRSQHEDANLRARTAL